MAISFLIPAVLGLLRGLYLKYQQPAVYAAMPHHQPTGAVPDASPLATPDSFWHGVEL